VRAVCVSVLRSLKEEPLTVPAWRTESAAIAGRRHGAAESDRRGEEEKARESGFVGSLPRIRLPALAVVRHSPQPESTPRRTVSATRRQHRTTLAKDRPCLAALPDRSLRMGAALVGDSGQRLTERPRGVAPSNQLPADAQCR
jgi:hypothetical protein